MTRDIEGKPSEKEREIKRERWRGKREEVGGRRERGRIERETISC